MALLLAYGLTFGSVVLAVFTAYPQLTERFTAYVDRQAAKASAEMSDIFLNPSQRIVWVLYALSPILVGPTSVTYITGAVVLGLGLLAVAIAMFRGLSRGTARAMLLASVIYLPALLSLLLIDRLSG